MLCLDAPKCTGDLLRASLHHASGGADIASLQRPTAFVNALSLTFTRLRIGVQLMWLAGGARRRFPSTSGFRPCESAWARDPLLMHSRKISVRCLRYDPDFLQLLW